MSKINVQNASKKLLKVIGSTLLLTITANIIIFIYNYICSVVWNLDISLLGFDNSTILLELFFLILFQLTCLVIGYKFINNFYVENNVKIELYQLKQNSTQNKPAEVLDKNGKKKEIQKRIIKNFLLIFLFSFISSLFELILGYFRNKVSSTIDGIFIFITFMLIYMICRWIIFKFSKKKFDNTNKSDKLFEHLSNKEKFVFFFIQFFVIISIVALSCVSSITNNLTYYIYEDDSIKQNYAVVFINDNSLVMEEVSISEDNTIHFYTAYQMFVKKDNVKLQKRSFKSKSIDYKITENKNTYEVVTPYLFGIIQLPFSD